MRAYLDPPRILLSDIEWTPGTDAGNHGCILLMAFLHPLFAAAFAFAMLVGPNLVAAATGLPLPRYVSLRASEVNVRTGPGVRYPVDWVFQRHGLPVEIVAEFDTWRKIRDTEGTEGWVHQSLLSGKRMLIVTGSATRTLRRKPSATARAIAKAEANVVGRLLECPKKSDWCRVHIGGFEGWMKRAAFWGVYPDELVK